MAITHEWFSLVVIVVGAVIFIALPGCSGMSQQEYGQFRHYVAGKVSPGMPVAKAIRVFEQEGYNCKDQGDRAECDRSEDGLMKLCRYSVFMHVDTKRKTVTKALPDILCARKYP